MNRDAVIRAAIVAVEAMDEMVSTRSVQAMCARICGKHLRPADILGILRERRDPETLGKPSGNGAETPAVLNSEQSGNVSETGRKPPHASAAADHKGILDSAQGQDSPGVTPLPSVVESVRARAPEPPPQPASPPSLAPVPDPPRSRPQLKLDTRTPGQIVADAVFAAIRPQLEPHLRGMTWSTWRSRNRRITADIAAAGNDTEAIVAAWTAGSERRGYPVTVMSWIAEDLNRAPRAEEPIPDRPPTITQLIAEGKVQPILEEDIPPWKRPPFHPRFIAWRAANPEALIPA